MVLGSGMLVSFGAAKGLQGLVLMQSLNVASERIQCKSYMLMFVARSPVGSILHLYQRETICSILNEVHFPDSKSTWVLYVRAPSTHCFGEGGADQKAVCYCLLDWKVA